MTQAKKGKCDEVRPVCARCKRNDRSCSYPTAVSLPERDGKRSGASSMTHPIGAATLPANPAWTRNETSTLHLLQHCLTHWNEIFHFPCDQRLLSMSATNPLVESTFLAVS